MTYLVDIPEVHIITYRVWAESEEEAVQKAQDGDGVEVNLEYSKSLDASVCEEEIT